MHEHKTNRMIGVHEMKNLIICCFLAVLCDMTRADSFESEYRSAWQFASLLEVDWSRLSSTTNQWTTPAFFVPEAGGTNYVSLSNSRDNERGAVIFVNCSSDDGVGKAMICNCSNQVATLEELFFPLVAFSSMPVEMKVPGYSATLYDNGLFELVKQSETNRFVMFAFGNTAIRYEGVDAKRRAIALLRAGGVDIPDASAPQNPDPGAGE